MQVSKAIKIFYPFLLKAVLGKASEKFLAN